MGGYGAGVLIALGVSMRFGWNVSIVGVCLAIFGVSGFYTMLLIALMRYIFDFEGRFSLVFVGALFCVVLVFVFSIQFSVLCKAWSRKG